MNFIIQLKKVPWLSFVVFIDLFFFKMSKYNYATSENIVLAWYQWVLNHETCDMSNLHPIWLQMLSVIWLLWWGIFIEMRLPHIVDRPAISKFRFNKPANNMDDSPQKLIIWVLKTTGTLCQFSQKLTINLGHNINFLLI